jgi:hypothetical protein
VVALSSIALQRIVVRMLYDPALVAAVQVDAARALADCELSEEEREWFRAADRRAFALDPYRRSRSLHALLEEYPVASALLVRARGGAALLDAFFGSRIFHTGMRDGRSLAALYGDYLHTQATPPALLAVIALERTIAAARRSIQVPSRNWSLARGVGIWLDCALVLDDYAASLAELRTGNSLLESILSTRLAVGTPRLSPPHAVLITTRPSTRLESVSPHIGQVLQAIARGADEAALLGLAGESQADEMELRALLAELAGEGVLMRSAAS